jgi:hypothetical protein
MDMNLNSEWTDQGAERLPPFDAPEPRQLDELPTGPGPTGAETALEAAFLARLMQIAGGHSATAGISNG